MNLKEYTLIGHKLLEPFSNENFNKVIYTVGGHL